MTQNNNDIFSAANASANDELAPFDVRDSSNRSGSVSYTHLTLPTNREV